MPRDELQAARDSVGVRVLAPTTLRPFFSTSPQGVIPPFVPRSMPASAAFVSMFARDGPIGDQACMGVVEVCMAF